MPTPSVASLYNYYSPHIVVVLLPPVAKSSIVRGTVCTLVVVPEAAGAGTLEAGGLEHVAFAVLH